MLNDVLFSSASVEWATPQELFDQIDAEFHFDLDAAATKENAKVARYYTAEDDGLKMPWGGCTWCNPPYGRTIGRWVQKAWQEAQRQGTTVVMLLPARTDTAWFHDYIYNRTEIRFIRGRIKFGGSATGAPFPSMLVIFRGPGSGGQRTGRHTVTTEEAST